MAELNAIMTEDGRLYWAKLFGNQPGYQVPILPAFPGWNPAITHFRIGEGGWVDLGAGAIQRPMDTTQLRYQSGIFGPPIDTFGMQDLDSRVDAARLSGVRYAVDSRFSYEKVFLPPDYIIEAPSTTRYRCRLELPEANNDGFGNSPEFWEIGLYSAHPDGGGLKLMVAYATMPKEIKHAAKIIENVLRIKF